MRVALFTSTEDSKRLLHKEESSKSEENTKSIPSNVSLFKLTELQRLKLPNKDVSLVFNHHKSNSRTLIFTHERVWNEVQENVGKETTSLDKAICEFIVSSGVSATTHTANAVIVLRVSEFISAGINARIKLGTLLIASAYISSFENDDEYARADVERPQDRIPSGAEGKQPTEHLSHDRRFLGL